MTSSSFARRLGKQPVVVGDKAGFIANALLFGYLNHAVSMYETRYASREDIDAAMRLGCGLPMGPLALMDLIGLDTAYEILDTMYRQGRDRLHAPSPLIKQMVSAGLRGRKTGRGFYTYAGPGSSAVVPDALTPSAVGVGGGVGAAGGARRRGRFGDDGVGDRRGVRAVRVRGDRRGAVAGEGGGRRRGGRRGRWRGPWRRGGCRRPTREAAVERVTPSTSTDDLAEVDLVVEAVVEDLGAKQELFRTLDKVCRPGAILATTTSSLPVIDLAAVTSRPEDVVGMHFFNPAALMRLVEVVSTVSTAPDVSATVVGLCASLGKHPVSCADRSGFIVNALLFPYLNDAVRMLEAHYATADDIDTAMKTGCGYPMGPFELLDVVGLDVSLAIQRELYLEFRERGYAPAPLLEHLVTAGYLGRKTGRGFRTYP